MMYLKAFLVGGLICVLGQILIDRTKLTPARILVLFVCVGCVLGGLGIAIISTNQGVVTDKKARELQVGGEVLAFIW